MAQKAAGLRRQTDPNLFRSAELQTRQGEIPAPRPELFAELVARMSDGVALHTSIRDDSGRIVDFSVDYANDALSRLTGLAHHDLVGHTMLEIFPGRRTNGLFDAYVRVVENGETLLREGVPGGDGFTERSGDARAMGAPGDSELRSDPEGFGTDCDIIVSKLGDGYVTVMRDVAGRRRAEQELFQSQNMLRAVLDTIPQRVFWKDRNSNFLGCNAPFAHDAGLSDPSELIGRNDDDMTWRAESERYRSDDRVVMETGEPKLMFEEPQPRPDGTVGWIRTSKVPQRDHTGQVVGVLGTYEDVTDQKRAEEALFESQEMLRLILDSVPQRVFWKDRDGKFLGANAAFVRDLGLADPKEIAGKTDFDLGQGDAAATYRADDQRVMKTGQAVLTYEERNIRPDGSNGWLRTSKLPLRDRSGAVVGVLGTFEDITESKRAEEALRKSEQLLDSIVDNIPDMVFVKDARDLSYVRVNRAEERMLGYSKEEILRGDDRGQSTPAEVEFFEAIDRQVLETGEIVDIPEERLTTIHGVKILHTTKIPIMNEEGRPRYLLGISEDVTERKAAEKARLESESRYRRMIDSITDYVVSVRIEHGQAVSVSHAAGSVAVIGYTPEELRADPGLWVSRVVPEDRELVEDSMRRVLTGERLGQIEHRIRRKDGTVRWVRHTPVLTFDDHGEVIAYDGLIQDVTETHILQDQLLHAQKMESIGRLAGGIAHDFNNLLTAILGYVEMARLDLPNIPADHPARTDLQEIATAGERAAALTRQLLTFASRQVVQTVRLDLNSLVTDSLNLLERLLGEDVEIEAVLDPKAGTIEADPVQISQLLVNLGVNAKDAMPRGGKLLIETGSETLDEETAQAHPGAHAGPHVVLAVTDTGQGMTPEVQSHLFEPFFTTKERGKGTGLGLATCHGIVRQMDGHIRVYSEVDRGTSFRIYLPAKNGPADRVAAADLDAPAPTGEETILVVEDEPGIRRLGLVGLRARGYVVLEAANGAEAVEIARRVGSDIDMVVSDVVMPGMSGPELLEQLAAIVPQARALLVSGHAESAILSPASSLRYAFLAKPFTPERLARMVREVLDSPRS
jgi:two-component system, cell cycle sensor histidine kinase and response regulator CckA